MKLMRNAINLFHEKTGFDPNYLGKNGILHEAGHIGIGDFSGAAAAEGATAIYEQVWYGGDFDPKFRNKEICVDISFLKEKINSRLFEGSEHHTSLIVKQKAAIAYTVAREYLESCIISSDQFNTCYQTFSSGEVRIRSMYNSAQQPWEQLGELSPTFKERVDKAFAQDEAIQISQRFLDEAYLSDDDIEWHIANSAAMSQLYSEYSSGKNLRDLSETEMLDIPLEWVGMEIGIDNNGREQFICLPELETRRTEILGNRANILSRPMMSAQAKNIQVPKP